MFHWMLKLVWAEIGWKRINPVGSFQHSESSLTTFEVSDKIPCKEQL